MTIDRTFDLDSRYTIEEGTIILTGLQALIRIPLDQYRADQRAGLNTATFISGYRGSPLGGFDTLLQRSGPLLRDHQIVFEPGVNEDLAATAVLGSQLANTLPEPKYDGVLGIWYGKGPGVDRSGDVFKHAQITGVGRYGGVLALAGDDPTAKSSTIPSHSEIALYDAQMPVLYPGSLQEIIEMGRFGLELSRYSGSWTGFKIVTNIADSYGTAYVSPIEIVKPSFEYLGRPWQHTQNPALLAPYSLMQEKEIHDGRLEAAKAFAAANHLNQITVRGERDRLGIIAAGKTYYDLREALQTLGLTNEDLHRYGIRLLKLGMIYPIEEAIVKSFAQGLDQLLIIEEKRAFIELFVRDILYNEPQRPAVYGKRDEQSHFLVRADHELDADQITELLIKRLAGLVPADRLHINREPAPAIALNMASSGQTTPGRTPYFCSGCPHNRSTIVPEGSLQGGGIGCHTLAILMNRNITGVTQMGGEGAQWVGASPFSHINHIFQNIGDGTLFHSGSLAIRQSVAAGANITYKILYNGAVAMTGGQQADGELSIPDLTRELQAEGVEKIIVCSDDPQKFPLNTHWAEGTEIWERDRLNDAQEILKEVNGVTAVIYDQACATELRRKRKRGLIEEPKKRVFINEMVCEGCGDCGDKSNCLSVFPVETEFGRKTQIHQSSCNKDYTCLEGDCPAFVTLETTDNRPQTTARSDFSEVWGLLSEVSFPEPDPLPPAESNIFMAGIGGTGVVTINQILATAALLDGKWVTSLDQTGLSQKGGPVASHLKVREKAEPISNMVSHGESDAFLVFDLLSGTDEKNLKRANPARTRAIVSSSEIPTGAMVKSKEVEYPRGMILKNRLEKATIAAGNVYFDAVTLAENLFGSHMPANMIVVGAAYQAGLLPITAVAIEHAISLNGVAIEINKNAFRLGRQIVADPNWLNTLNLHRPGSQPTDPTPNSQHPSSTTHHLTPNSLPDELTRLLNIRIPHLIAYQNEGYAREYVSFVEKVVKMEEGIGDGRLSENVARYLYKLMAYKDEYEVARLYLRPEFEEAIRKQFGPQAKVTYQLHPPFMRALGMKKKIPIGRWFKPFFRLLYAMRGLRGTPFDLFGYANVRRVERELIGEYRQLIEELLTPLKSENYDAAVALAALPDMIRGYEEIKLAGVEKFRRAVAERELSRKISK
ncbi:MAG: indolepyruvate ferredoxin oxidoreductase family protein [Ardenticatenaceae bacterium]|nr:indolepyruvate ferredoxin oxidoreductase family protein [Ardenticatenaceae bacterium]